MRRLFIMFGILTILASCNQKNNKDFESLNYTKLKQPMCYFAKTDSGFILKAESNKDYTYKYIEYVIDKDEIRMYSDSLYDFTCMIFIFYPIDFYVNHLGGFRNRANCKIDPTGEIVDNRYVYRTRFSSFNSPDFEISLKGLGFSINGNEFRVELDSMEVRTLLPTFEPTLYTAKGL
ncbi:hypothetical protein [Bacteroides sp.]|uniref:hypothetical protein n=1 Tax=Bacteroides sp. TaxID=29523 RepID=UPI002A812D54|nr:hypothetical protein [Bacteroides sp.]